MFLCYINTWTFSHCTVSSYSYSTSGCHGDNVYQYVERLAFHISVFAAKVEHSGGRSSVCSLLRIPWHLMSSFLNFSHLCHVTDVDTPTSSLQRSLSVMSLGLIVNKQSLDALSLWGCVSSGVCVCVQSCSVSVFTLSSPLYLFIILINGVFDPTYDTAITQNPFTALLLSVNFLFMDPYTA